ncbi:hypothetical protein ECLT68_2573 [Escherichia coli LT-68]|nr:hypothetical protein ECLT68_2573 [Escherichia coli LT-68]
MGCKLPNGLVLEVGQKRVQVAGWRNNAVKIVGGYGLTQVDKVFLTPGWRSTDSNLM